MACTELNEKGAPKAHDFEAIRVFLSTMVVSMMS
jgi:hypothetical protein